MANEIPMKDMSAKESVLTPSLARNVVDETTRLIEDATGININQDKNIKLKDVPNPKGNGVDDVDHNNENNTNKTDPVVEKPTTFQRAGTSGSSTKSKHPVCSSGLTSPVQTTINTDAITTLARSGTVHTLLGPGHKSHDPENGESELSRKETIQLTNALGTMVTALHQGNGEVPDVTMKSRNSIFSRIMKKVRTRNTWTVVMVLLGLLYMTANIINVVQLWHTDLKYELVVGPPVYVMKILIAVFTAIGTLGGIFEIVNTMSVYCHGGFPVLSITVEMLGTIPTVHIPIAALNYFTASCRVGHTSMMQIMSGAFSISYVCFRMVWFAHLMGKKIKLNDKKDIKQGLFMLTCALFSCAMAFQILSWRGTPPGALSAELTNNVSLVFLKTSFSRNQQVKTMDATDLYKQQGMLIQAPHMLPNLSDVINAGPKGMTGYYLCRHGKVVNSNDSIELPYLCPNPYDNVEVDSTDTESELNTGIYQGGDTHSSTSTAPNLGLIKFHVVFKDGNDLLPFGEVHFNYAIVSDINITAQTNHSHIMQWSSQRNTLGKLKQIVNKQKLRKKATPTPMPTSRDTHDLIGGYEGEKPDDVITTTEAPRMPSFYISGLKITGDLTEGSCKAGSEPIKHGWGLWYLTITKAGRKSNRLINVESPWIYSCTTPYPRYNPDIEVC